MTAAATLRQSRRATSCQRKNPAHITTATSMKPARHCVPQKAISGLDLELISVPQAPVSAHTVGATRDRLPIAVALLERRGQVGLLQQTGRGARNAHATGDTHLVVGVTLAQEIGLRLQNVKSPSERRRLVGG